MIWPGAPGGPCGPSRPGRPRLPRVPGGPISNCSGWEICVFNSKKKRTFLSIITYRL